MAIIIWMKVIKLLYLFLGSQILHVCFTICLLYFRDFTNNKNAHEKGSYFEYQAGGKEEEKKKKEREKKEGKEGKKRREL